MFEYRIWTGCNQQIGDDPFAIPMPHGACWQLHKDIAEGWEPYLLSTCPGGYQNKYTEMTIMLRRKRTQIEDREGQ